jgi:polyisoprenoid-binding protein YceI
MWKRAIHPLACCAVTLAIASPAAGGWLIEIDPPSSSISFTLSATLHTVHGTAAVESGSIIFDPATGSAIGEIAVSASSASTDNRKRDKKMHLKVLRSGDFPKIVLHARSIEGRVAATGSSEIVLHSVMEILGRRHDLDVTLNIEIAGDRFTARGAITIPYVDWGLTDPSTFVLRVAKQVEVKVLVAGTIRSRE